MVFVVKSDPLMKDYESDVHKHISKHGSKDIPIYEHTNSSSHEYAEALREWMRVCHFTQMVNSLNTSMTHYAVMPTPALITAEQIGTTINVAAGTTPVVHHRVVGATVRRVVIGNHHTHHAFYLPPLWKRICAELIDFFCLFIIKVILMIAYIEYVGITENSPMNVLSSANIYQMDMTSFITLTSRFFYLEIFNRVMIIIYEAFLIAGWFSFSPYGQTPGKQIMGLRVVNCENITSLTATNRYVVHPAGNISLYNSFTRSTLKNSLTSLLIPVFLSSLLNPHKQTFYDIMSNSIVIDASYEEI